MHFRLVVNDDEVKPSELLRAVDGNHIFPFEFSKKIVSFELIDLPRELHTKQSISGKPEKKMCKKLSDQIQR